MCMVGWCRLHKRIDRSHQACLKEHERADVQRAFPYRMWLMSVTTVSRCVGVQIVAAAYQEMTQACRLRNPSFRHPYIPAQATYASEHTLVHPTPLACKNQTLRTVFM